MIPLSSDQPAPLSHRGYAVAVQALSITIGAVALAIIAMQPMSALGLIILGGVAGVGIVTFALATYFALRKQQTAETAQLPESSETDEAPPVDPAASQKAPSVEGNQSSAHVEAPTQVDVSAVDAEIAEAKAAVEKLFATLEKTADSLLTNPKLGISESDRTKQKVALKQLIISCKALLYPYLGKRHVCESKPLLRLQIMAAHNAGNIEKRDALIAEFKGERQDIADKNARILAIMKGGILKAQIYLENFKMLIESGTYDKAQLAKAYAQYDLNELRMFCVAVLTPETIAEAEAVFTAQIGSPTEVALLKKPAAGEELAVAFEQIFGKEKKSLLPAGYSAEEWIAVPCDMRIKEGSGLKKMPLPKSSFTMRIVLSLLGGLIPRLLAKAFVKHGFSQGKLAEKNEKRVADSICTNLSNLLQPFMSPLYGSNPAFRTLLTQLVAQNEAAFQTLAEKLTSTDELTFASFITAAEEMTQQLETALQQRT